RERIPEPPQPRPVRQVPGSARDPGAARCGPISILAAGVPPVSLLEGHYRYAVSSMGSKSGSPAGGDAFTDTRSNLVDKGAQGLRIGWPSEHKGPKTEVG